MNKKFNVLIVLNEAPLPFSGAASRWYHILIQGLEKRGVNFTIVGSCKKYEEKVELEKKYPQSFFYLHDHHKKNLFQKIKTLFRPFSYTAPKEMREKIKSLDLNSFNVVHVEQVFATYAFDKIPKHAFVSVHYLASLDQANVETFGLRDKLISWLMKYTEKKLLKNYGFVKTCSQEIEEKIRSWYPEKKYSHFPFAIDPSQYNFVPDEVRPKGKNVLLVASMNWLPGKTAAINLIERIWPLIKANNPQAILRIVGFDARTVLLNYLNEKQIEIYENVPDVFPYFEQANILVYFPNAGSGVKIKIQESMLIGIPVITNQFGAEGLNLQHLEHCMLANNEFEAAKWSHQLLNDFELQNNIRKKARAFIESECSEEKIISKIELIYLEIGKNNE